MNTLTKIYLGILFFCLGLAAACAYPPPSNPSPPATHIPTPRPLLVNRSRLTAQMSAVSLPAVSRTPIPTRSATPSRPNIVLILTDDQAFQDVQYMPRLEALLADKGVSFSNYFVSDSLCCPSRTSILRGQYSHNTKIFGNVPPAGGFQKFFGLGSEHSTIATWLHDAGYRTALIGKYLNGYPKSAGLVYIPPGWDAFYSPIDSSAYRQFNYRLNANGKLIRFGKDSQDYGTDVYARYAASFVGQALRDRVPFFLFLTPFAPHLPATPAKRDASLFPELEAPRTASFNEADVSDKPNFVEKHPLLNAGNIAKLDLIYRKRAQSLQAVDRMIGALASQLEQAGAWDNTYVFFSSDNGFHLGQHRLEAGKTTAYEEDIHVPLIVRGPGIPAGQTVRALAANIDLAPTWLELAGVAVPDFVDGRSLVSLLHGSAPSAAWRQVFSIENGESAKQVPTATPVPLATPTRPPFKGLEEVPDPFDDRKGHHPDRKLLPYRGLRTSNLKFVRYSDGEMELYDLQRDPEEMENIAARVPRNIINTLLTRLDMFAHCAGVSCRAAEDAPAPSLESVQTAAATPTP